MRQGPWEGGVYRGGAYGGRVFEEVGSMRKGGSMDKWALWEVGSIERRGLRPSLIPDRGTGSHMLH